MLWTASVCNRHLSALVPLLAILCAVSPVQAADEAPASTTQIPIVGPLLDAASDALDADGEGPLHRRIHWNEYDLWLATIRIGGSLKYDTANYDQDAESQDQMPLSPDAGIRDLRMALGGRFRYLPPRFSYVAGFMYDGSTDDWRVRRTGILIDVPEFLGNLFIGRTKEGFSTSKLMVGTQSWTMEGSAVTDALLPELGDGIRWTGRVPSGRFVYNLGLYADAYSQNESFNRNDAQFIARGVWLPFTAKSDRLLHLAMGFRYGTSDDGFLQYRAKPESGLAESYAIDTGRFPADHATTASLEAYYRRSALTLGSEYYLNFVNSHETNDPFFHGGEVFAAYLLTGETRPYVATGGYFGRITPSRPVLDRGWGAWEAVMRFSYADFDSEGVRGGKFWRITPMMNWYVSNEVRLEFAYGYGMLDRFTEQGATQFFQTRLQFQL